MWMKSFRWCGLAVILAAGVCVAQEREEPVDREKGRNRPRRFAERPGRMDWKARLDRMTEELKLDEDQQTQVRELLKAHGEMSREFRKGDRYTPEEREKMNEFREAMRAARKAEDEQQVEELLQQRRAMMQERDKRIAPIREKRAAAEKELHGHLLSVMREDQKAGFEEIWEKMRWDRSHFGTPRNPRVLKRAVDRLPDLAPEQKQEIAELFDAFKKATRETERRSREYQTLLRKLHGDVLKVLTVEQREQVTKETLGRRGGPEGRLERGKRHRGRRGADRRGDERGNDGDD